MGKRIIEGQDVLFPIEVRDTRGGILGVLVAATAITLTVTAPDATIATFTLSGGGIVAAGSTGKYIAIVPAAMLATTTLPYTWRVVVDIDNGSGGTLRGVEQDVMLVEGSNQ